MSKPYDAAMRTLVELEPAAWLDFLGIPVPDPALVQVIDSNLSAVTTVTADSDKLVRVGGPRPFLFHPEFLSGRAVEARKILIELGRKRFGEPDATILARVAAIADPDRLDAMVVRILDAASWDDLLAPAIS